MRDKTLADLKSFTAKTLWLLFNYIKDKTTFEFYYSVTTLQELTGYTRPAILNGIKELESKKIIKCNRRIGTYTIYKLLKPYKMTLCNGTGKMDLPDQLNGFTSTGKMDLPDPILDPKSNPKENTSPNINTDLVHVVFKKDKSQKKIEEEMTGIPEETKLKLLNSKGIQKLKGITNGNT